MARLKVGIMAETNIMAIMNTHQTRETEELNGRGM